MVMATGIRSHAWRALAAQSSIFPDLVPGASCWIKQR
jgi:hypothetical protein